MIEYRVGRQVIDIFAGDRHVHEAAVTGVFVERRDQPVPVVPRLYQKAEVAEAGLSCLTEEESCFPGFPSRMRRRPGHSA